MSSGLDTRADSRCSKKMSQLDTFPNLAKLTFLTRLAEVHRIFVYSTRFTASLINMYI